MTKSFLPSLTWDEGFKTLYAAPTTILIIINTLLINLESSIHRLIITLSIVSCYSLLLWRIFFIQFLFAFLLYFLITIYPRSLRPPPLTPSAPPNHHTVVHVHEFFLSLFLFCSIPPLPPHPTPQELSACSLCICLYFVC